MRIGISNIAWEIEDDAKVASILARHGVDAIDVAPSKYFPDPATATDAQIRTVKQAWSERGIEITGMQALLFGTTGLNVFGTESSRGSMLEHLARICRIGAGLGAKRLVFGSPRNRDRSALGDEEAMEMGVSFFRRLADVASRSGVTICLEPNPPAYGANFMTTGDETALVVRNVDHPSIRMQLDTGAVTMNSEDVFGLLQRHSELVGHIHASEPNLATLGSGGTDHAAMAKAVRAWLPGHVVTVEMLPSKTEPHTAAVERAVAEAVARYGSEEEAPR